MATIMSVNVCDSKYNADPTGVRDSTSAIQKAVDDVAAQGGGSVEIPGGMYRVSYPFIEMKHRVEIFGHGQATRIVAFTDKSIPSSKNGSYECTGVFHTGSYTTPMSGGTNQNKPMRMGVRDLFIRTNKYNLPLDSKSNQIFLEKHTQPVDNVAGVIFHTRIADANPGEPDAVPTLSNIEIWDTAIGVAILGLDDQGMKIDKIRIRQTLRQGLLVGKPVGHPLRAREGDTPGAADNKFSMIDVSDANMSFGTYAGIEIYTSQSKFEASTSWFNKRNQGKNALYEVKTRHVGAGWFIQGTRNMFIGCTAQENAGHGWLVEWGNNQFIGCLGESSSFQDAVTGGARGDEAANWYIGRNARGSRFVAPRSHNPYSWAKASLYGFYIENNIRDMHITTASAKDDRIGENNMVGRRVHVTGAMGDNVLIEVDHIRHATFAPKQLEKRGNGVFMG